MSNYAKPITNAVRAHFSDIYQSAIDGAKEDYRLLETKMADADHFEKFKLLTDENRRIEGYADLLAGNTEHQFFFNRVAVKMTNIYKVAKGSGIDHHMFEDVTEERNRLFNSNEFRSGHFRNYSRRKSRNDFRCNFVGFRQ